MGSGMMRLGELCREQGVALAYLFGSQRELGLRRYRLYSEIYNAFTDLFPGQRLDLVFLQEGHAVFQAQAVIGPCVFAVNETYRDDYEHRILARAADFRPVLDLLYRERLEEVGR